MLISNAHTCMFKSGPLRTYKSISVFIKIQVFGVSPALTAGATETHTASPRVSRLLLLPLYRDNSKVSREKSILDYTLQDFSDH